MTYYRTIGFLLFCISLVFVLFCTGTVSADDLKVHFIDVGEGDAILLQQDNATMLVDAGPASASEDLIPYIQGLGITTINTLLTTHPDPAHIGGTAAVLSNFQIDRYLDNGEEDGDGAHAALMQAVTTAGTSYEQVASGSQIPFSEDTSVDVLSPALLTGDLNHDSVVLKVTRGNTTFLFMGDADKAAEKLMIEEGLGEITILKIADHGDAAATSQEFLEETNPEVVVIMDGKANPEGHPDLETLKTLNESGVFQIYQTMNDGTIIISTDGNDYFVTKKPVPEPGISEMDSAGTSSAAKTAKILFQTTGT